MGEYNDLEAHGRAGSGGIRGAGTVHKESEEREPERKSEIHADEERSRHAGG